MKQYLNTYVLTVASFEKSLLFFKNEDENKCLLIGKGNVQKPFKKKDEEYYQTFVKTFKLFGKAAIQANKVLKPKMNIVIEGFLDIDDDYTTSEGELRRGQEFINARSLDVISPLYTLTDNDSDTSKSMKKPEMSKKTTMIKKPGTIKKPMGFTK